MDALKPCEADFAGSGLALIKTPLTNIMFTFGHGERTALFSATMQIIQETVRNSSGYMYTYTCTCSICICKIYSVCVV